MNRQCPVRTKHDDSRLFRLVGRDKIADHLPRLRKRPHTRARRAPTVTVMNPQPGALYVVATPIGNLEDITLRALRILREVDLIAAEHVPVARVLLRRFEIDTPVVSYHDRGSDPLRLVRRIEQGESIALVSDAGTPGLSDPGRNLVAAAAAAGARVLPIPGPAAAIALWSVSGADDPQVLLHGFLPRKRNERREALRTIAARGIPTLVFESPRRIIDMLADIDLVAPDAQLVIGREMTKLHEEFWRGSPADAADAFREPRGEFTVLIIPPAAEAESWSDRRVSEALADAAAQGASRSQAARQVARLSGRPRRDIYALWPYPEQHE